MRIALDAMGGDRAPGEIVAGAVIAAREFGVDIALVGPPELVEPELRKHGPQPRLSIVPSGGQIEMGEGEVVDAVRHNRDASINVAMSMVRDGNADAVVSAGNTGAVGTSAALILRRIHGVERAAIGTLVPYNNGKVFLIDAGANADCRPSQLVQFAEMGSAYVEKVVRIPRPRIGLLNIGEEAGKGNELMKETYDRLKESDLNFVGNVEGVHVHKGVCDVIVTDGFTGNIALKVGEGVADYVLQEVRKVIKSSYLFIAAAVLLKPALKRALKSLNYEEYGGANLLGVNGIVVIAHGRSDAVAVKNALRFAHDAASSDLMETMKATFARPADLVGNK